MGYAKNPGGFWDTVGVLIVLMFTAELLLFVVTLWAGTPELFQELNTSFFTLLKEFFFSWTALIVLVVALILGGILYAWRDAPYEE